MDVESQPVIRGGEDPDREAMVIDEVMSCSLAALRNVKQEFAIVVAFDGERIRIRQTCLDPESQQQVDMITRKIRGAISEARAAGLMEPRPIESAEVPA